jgi:hypothetical protein
MKYISYVTPDELEDLIVRTMDTIPRTVMRATKLERNHPIPKGPSTLAYEPDIAVPN